MTAIDVAPRRRKNAWTPDEIAEITRRYPHERVDSIARDLGRGRAGVADKANKLGLRKPSRRPWTKDELDVIRKRYADEPAHSIARELDRHESTIYYQAKQLGLEKAPDFLRKMAQRPRAPRSDSWTHRELEDLRRLYPYERTADLAAIIGRSPEATNSMAFKLGTQKSPEYMVEQNARLTEGGKKHRIQKGAVPPNKGLRRPGWGPGRMKETQFKKGHDNGRELPLGSCRQTTKERHWRMKVARGGRPQDRWVELHKLVWMEHNGPIPQGHIIRFINGDPGATPEDVTIDRLECISKAENMRRNTIHNLPKEVVDVIQQRGRLTREINKQRRAHEEQH